MHIHLNCIREVLIAVNAFDVLPQIDDWCIVYGLIDNRFNVFVHRSYVPWHVRSSLCETKIKNKSNIRALLYNCMELGNEQTYQYHWTIADSTDTAFCSLSFSNVESVCRTNAFATLTGVWMLACTDHILTIHLPWSSYPSQYVCCFSLFCRRRRSRCHPDHPLQVFVGWLWAT